MERNIIVAVSDNNAIGKAGTLPWHLSEDLKYFRKTTTGGTVVMGRKTYESIGRPLPGRVNIVLSHSCPAPEGTVGAASIEDAFSVAGSLGKPCFVIGGGEVYRKAFGLADRLYVTHVHTVVEDADTFFPDISPDIWREVSRSERRKDPGSGYEFEFAVYERK